MKDKKVVNFPGHNPPEDLDKYKAFIAVLIEHEGDIEVTLPEGFTKAEIMGMLEMAKLIVMDTFQ